MIRNVILGLIILLTALSISCGGNSNPVTSDSNFPEGLTQSQNQDTAQTHLWGFYEVNIGLSGEEPVIVCNRQAMFTANVVNFLNTKPTSLGFIINDIVYDTEYIDVDIDVTLTHPFPGLTQYNGYDVRGVFMGNGSGSMAYNSSLDYPILGTDQMMFPDPDFPITDEGRPDGYTRWFNRTEFLQGGMPLFQYTQGKVATPGFAGTATICPYKYYADTLTRDDDLWTWLNDPLNINTNGVFSSGQANTRNYYLRFPLSTGVTFGYAVLANWGGPDIADHPSNAEEAISINLADSSNVFYKDPSTNGGNLIFDISVWDWQAVLSGSEMTEYKLLVESTVTSTVYTATSIDMTPVGGNENYSTYHLDIPADNVTGTDGNEYWIIVESQNADYSNEFGSLNDAWNDPLAAFFRFDLEVGSAAPPVAKAKIETAGPYSPCQSIHFVDDGSYDPDGTIVLFEWDWDNDGVYDEEGSDVYHKFGTGGTQDVQFRVTDNDSLTDVLDTPLSLSLEGGSGWADTWGGSYSGPDYYSDQGRFCAVDSVGDIYVAGQFAGTDVDFDPDPTGSSPHTSMGGIDAFIVKFNACGQFIWAQTWGGSSNDSGWGVAIDSQDNVIVHGTFAGTVDFDPGTNTDNHASIGEGDCFISKFDSTGGFIWAETWGCYSYDNAYNVTTGPDDSIYVAGEWFYSSIDLNPDPAESDVQNLIGASDRYLSKFDSSGDYLWGKSWGGSLWDGGQGLDVDSQGIAYIGGHYRGLVDFDPDPVDTSYINCINYPVASAVVSAFDSTGDYLWARLLTGTSASMPAGIALDSTDSMLYITGAYNGSNADFDPGTNNDPHSTAGGDDAYLTVFDSSGAFQFAETWGGTSDDLGWHVSRDDSDNVVVCGRFASTGADFDPGAGSDPHSSNGGMDCFASRFDSSGAFQWARTWGAGIDDTCLAVANPFSNEIYVTGYFGLTTDFDPGADTDDHTASGTTDAFLVKFNSEGNW